MIRPLVKVLPARVLSAAILALAMFGLWVTTHATWVVARGGNTAFDGAFDYPGWSIVHFVSALVFMGILPFQLWARLRRTYPRIHRLAGRVAAVCGSAFSLTGLILPFVMPARPFGERAFMATVGGLFGFLLWRGIAAARCGDIATHRRWMLRLTAAALAPLTQRVIFPFFAATGIDSIARFWDLFVTALWFATAINLVIAEWWIQRTDASTADRIRGVRERELVAASQDQTQFGRASSGSR